MDAVKFLKEYDRMCKSYGHDCGECGIDKMRNGDGCTSIIHAHPEEAVAIVEKWSAEHPMKTRQSEFLKLFPNADIGQGYLNVCPKRIDLNSLTEDECADLRCSDCRKKYWLAEVE